MNPSEKEVAFRKKKRDYAIVKPKNAIQAGTKVIKVKGEKFIRPETLLARARRAKVDKRKLDTNRKRKASHNFPQPEADVKSALVVRLTPKDGNLCADSAAILAEFKLVEKLDGCFVQLTDENREKLRAISHLIFYGVPTPELIRQLVHTKAHTVQDGKEVLITSNKVVTDSLGQIGVEGLSDIAHAISKGEDTIEAIAAFLAPFHFMKDFKERMQSGWLSTDVVSAFVEKIL
jgi:large subunit ribosomal protein L7e